MTEATAIVGDNVNKCWFGNSQLLPIFLFQKALLFKSKVQLKARGRTVDAKNDLIIMVMSMGLVEGTEVTIIAEGLDEKEAVKALKELIESDANEAYRKWNEFVEEKKKKEAERKRLEEIRRAERLERLKKYTDDENILAKVDEVAFDQEDLKNLLNTYPREIYLCANRFIIPLNRRNRTYIGIGKAVAVIRKKEPVDFSFYNIEFKNIAFDDDYKKLLSKKIPRVKKSVKASETITTPKVPDYSKCDKDSGVDSMKRKERCSLLMADGAQVRNIDDLKAHFNLGAVVKHFKEGKLLTWLDERYYDDEAAAVKEISLNDEDLEQKLCAVFGIEPPEEVVRRAERLNRLKQYTTDKNILANVDKVAFDQEDLADLLDEGVDEIYLCANRFVIPLRMKNKSYIGVGEAVAIIGNNKPADFAKLGIKFKNVALGDAYQKQSADNSTLPVIATPTKQDDDSKIETPEIKEEIKTTVKNFNTACAVSFAQMAKKFTSTIKLNAKNKTVDGKSILRLMTISWGKSNKVTVIANGSDAKEAVDALKKLIDSGFPNASTDINIYSEINFTIGKDLQESQSAILWQKANTFKSEIQLRGKDKSGNTQIVNVKNIRELMTANFNVGEEFTLAAEGEDAKQTVTALKKLIDSGFPESSAKGSNCAATNVTIGNLNRTSGDSAAVFVQVAKKFKSKILLRANGGFVEGKGLLSVVSMGFVKGAEIIILAEGEDARQSVTALKKLIDSGFPESSAKGGNCAATNVTIGNMNNSDDSAIAFVQTAKKFKATIWLKKNQEFTGGFIEGKNLLSVIDYGFSSGDEVDIVAEGSDAKKAVEALKNLIESGFPAPSVKENEICAAAITTIKGEVQNYGGACYLLIETAKKFKATILLKTLSVYMRSDYWGGKDGRHSISSEFVDVKNDLMGLVLGEDAEIKIIAEGSDAIQAVSAIKSIIDSNFRGAPDKNTGMNRATMVMATTVITNLTGICARPASVFVQKASSFKSKIQLKAKGKTVDAKSILMIMSMGLVRGTVITIVADGPDAQEAVKALKEIVDNQFYRS